MAGENETVSCNILRIARAHGYDARREYDARRIRCDRPPSRGVFQYLRRPRWKFSSSSSPLTVVVAMSFFLAFTAASSRPLNCG